MRDPGTIKDQIWIIPYNQEDTCNLSVINNDIVMFKWEDNVKSQFFQTSVPSSFAFPVIEVDTTEEYVLMLDSASTLWTFENITDKKIKISQTTNNKVKHFKLWGTDAVVYTENNELLQVSLLTFESNPVKPGL
jgi:hypothetical protein